MIDATGDYMTGGIRKTWRVRGRALVALLVAGAMFVAACSDSGDDTAGTDSADSGGKSGEITRLVYASASPIRALDYLGLLDAGVFTLMLNNVNETLTEIAYDKDGNPEWRPLLAESWERVGPLQWRFHLRKGILFQNGEEFDAADVAFSINKAIAPGAEEDNAVTSFDRAEVVDDLTVDVYTATPDSFVYRGVYRLGIQPEGWGIDNKDEASTTAVGTGPYRLKEFSPGGDGAILERWDGYWGDNESVIDEIEMRVIPEAAGRLAALQAEEVDVALGLPPGLLATAPNQLIAPGVEVHFMRIDTKTPPLDNVEVRRAMNMAIDRELLIKSLHEGFAEPANGQGVPPTAFGFNDELKDYEYDPDAARKIIEAEGATGAKLNLVTSIERGGPLWGDISNTVAQMLNDVGLDVTVEVKSLDDWLQQGLLAPQNGLTSPSLFHLAASTDTLEAGSVTTSWFSCDSGRSTFCNAEVEAAMKAANKLDDLDQLESAWKDVLALIREEAPMIWLTTPQVGVGTAEGVDGVVFPLIESGDFYLKLWSV